MCRTACASPAALKAGRHHVSGLAREVQLSRPLVHMHLQRLEAAGLVTGHLELSEEGKAMKFFDVTPPWSSPSR